MSTRTKAILSVLLLITVLSSIFISSLVVTQNQALDNIINAKIESANLLSENLLEQTAKSYQKRIKSFVNYKSAKTKHQFIQAFAYQDRQTLQQLTNPFLEIFNKENPYFASMSWILPDNTVFLRVHKPDTFGDNISTLRPDLVEANSTKRQYSGFDAAYLGMQYRIVEPVEYNGKHLGIVQFGIRASFISDALEEKFHMLSGLAVINKECMNVTAGKMPLLKGSTHTIRARNTEIFNLLPENIDWNQKQHDFSNNGKHYVLLNVLPLLNYADKQLGNYFIILDVTEEKLATTKLIFATFATCCIFLILSFFIIYFSYSSLVQRIVNLNTSLEKNNRDLENNIIERTAELAAEKERLQAITENVPGVIFQFYASNSGETGIHYASSKLLDIFGIEFINNPQLFLQTFIHNIHEDDRASWIDSVKDVVEKQIPWKWTGRYVKPMGETIWFEGQATPTVRKDEIVFDGILIDITEKIEQEARKLESSLQKEQLKNFESLKTMAAAIAHRFNNAMTSVQGNLDLMTYTLPADSNEHKMASDAAQAARGASQVGSMMLSYVGQQPLKLKEIPLEVLVREKVLLLKSLLQPSISLQFSPPEHPLYCSMDEQQIKEVVESILNNAIESLDNSTGTIEITFGTEYFEVDSFPISFQNDDLKDGMYSFCKIKDSGHGINQENLLRIFEPFYTTRFVGRGLGLALTVGIMRSHHGAITIESSSDKGTTVRVLLPSLLNTPKKVFPSDRKQNAVIEFSGDILLADDEEMILDVGMKMIGILGFNVHTAKNGQEAVDRICDQDSNYCAVILDVSMPEMDGIEAMRTIRKTHPDLPIILSSGYSMEDLTSKKNEDDKPDGFLSKPFQLSDVQSCLEKILS